MVARRDGESRRGHVAEPHTSGCGRPHDGRVPAAWSRSPFVVSHSVGLSCPMVHTKASLRRCSFLLGVQCPDGGRTVALTSAVCCGWRWLTEGLPSSTDCHHHSVISAKKTNRKRYRSPFAVCCRSVPTAKKYRNDRRLWERVERYIAVRSDADFSLAHVPGLRRKALSETL